MYASAADDEGSRCDWPVGIFAIGILQPFVVFSVGFSGSW